MLRGLRTVAYRVTDLKAAKDWYSELLGFGPYFDQPFYVGFEVGGYELGLLPTEGEALGVGGDTPYWAVDDLEAAVARAETLGAAVLSGPRDVGGGVHLASLRDPFGNVLGLIVNPAFRPAQPTDPTEGPVTVVERGARLGAAPDDLSDRSIELQTVVRAPVSDVWPLWATSEGLRSWLVEAAHVELRIGGAYEVHFHPEAPEGSRGSEGCRILAFRPPELLCFTWNAPPHLPETRSHRTWVVLQLTQVADGTRVQLSHLGWPASGFGDLRGPWPATYAYFEVAWSQVLKALREHLG